MNAAEGSKKRVNNPCFKREICTHFTSAEDVTYTKRQKRFINEPIEENSTNTYSNEDNEEERTNSDRDIMTRPIIQAERRIPLQLLDAKIIKLIDNRQDGLKL